MPRRSRWFVAVLAGVLAVGVGAAAWWLWSGASESEPGAPQPVLQVGSTGEHVRAWQEQLDRAGFPLEADGVFGPATDRATRAFQAAASLPVDGVVDPATRDAMARRLE